jgi:hypothetical protein
MKTIHLLKIFSLMFLPLIGSVLASCDWAFGYTDAQLTSGFDVYYNKSSKLAFAASVNWDGGESGTTYTIPDMCNDCSVNALGGFFGRGVPCPFEIIVTYEGPNPKPESENPDDFATDAAELVPANSEIHIYSFIVNIGANLSKIQLVEHFFICSEQTDGSYYVSRSSVFFNVDSANPNFCSKDGGIYNRSDDSLALDWIIDQA